MKRNISFLMVMIGLVAGLTASPGYADLGLADTLASDGEKGVGLAVKTAVEALYGSGKSDAEIQSELVAIINEAVATGNEEAVRYTIVAVLLGGGLDNLALGKAAVDESNAFEQYPETTAFTVSSATALLSGGASGGAKTSGGGAKTSGGGTPDQTSGGGSPTELEYGGGTPPQFDDDGDVSMDYSYGVIDDRDTAATPI